jgi:hypothetical protein
LTELSDYAILARDYTVTFNSVLKGGASKHLAMLGSYFTDSWALTMASIKRFRPFAEAKAP